jgi:ketosteroid isomerase-like protein
MKRRIAFALCVLALWSCNAPKPAEEPAKTDAQPVTAEAPKPFEFADQKYVDICKDAMAKLSSGDVDGFINNYADNAVYRWNSFDSLAGKAAITEYWKNRRQNVITKLTFTDAIWLSLKVTDANKENVRKGNWVLGWYTTDATYKTGKSIHQAMHMLYHFNNEDKIDEIIHYLDRGAVQAASGK